jgi:glutamate--cysteine ligase catalytic subunit
MRGPSLTRFAQIEYLVVTFDDLHDKARLSLCQADVLEALAKDEELNKSGGCVLDLQPR